MRAGRTWSRQTALARLSQAGKLIATWSLAILVSLLGVATGYKLLLGQTHVVSNETIYEGHYKVGQPDTVEYYTREGRGWTSYGEHGLVVNKTLNPAVTRVLFLGDSFTQGRHVSDNEKFTEIVEQRWNSTHAHTIQTLNLGLGGLGMADYVYFAQNVDRTFEPNLVFLLISADDLGNAAQFERALTRLGRPPKRNPASSLLDFLNETGYYAFLRQMIKQTQGFAENKSFATLDYVGQTDPAPPDSTSETNVQDVATQLDQIHQRWGDRLVIIYHSSAPGIDRHATTAGNEQVWQEIQNQGIPAIDLCPALDQAFQAHTPPTGFANSILGRGHFNRHGHAIVAAEVVAFLEARDDLE
jgi:lysophospholipase L1-like esterase